MNLKLEKYSDYDPRRWKWIKERLDSAVETRRVKPFKLKATTSYGSFYNKEESKEPEFTLRETIEL